MKTAIFLGKKPTELNGYRHDELSLAKITNCDIWLEGDPRTFNESNSSLFDRSKNAWIQTANSVKKSVLDGKFVVPAVISDSMESNVYNLNLDVESDLTITVVFKVIKDAVNIIFDKLASETATRPFIFGWTAAKGLTLWNVGLASRLRATSDTITNALALGKSGVLTATISKTKGLTIWLNGVKVAENTTDLNGIDSSGTRLAILRSVGLGHVLIHKKDLSLDVNLAEMGLLHQTLLDYYQIEKLN